MTSNRFRGVLVPVVTPFDADLQADHARFSQFCRYLLDEGADGLAIFGTTSEANSMSGDERMALLDRLVEAGTPADKLMPGCGATSFSEAVRLTRHAMEHGCGGVLMLPPFYYKGVSDDGLFAFFSETIQRIGSDALKIYLYHIPPVAQVAFSHDLIERLISSYPGTVVGIKDSSGYWSNTKALLDRFPGFDVFAGSEVFLLDTLRAGGTGCITATGSVHVRQIRKIYETWQTAEADELQAFATAVRKTIQDYPVIPAVKSLIAHYNDDPVWSRVRPPLDELDSERSTLLVSRLEKLGFRLSAMMESVG